jgi:hypothetical protein
MGSEWILRRLDWIRLAHNRDSWRAVDCGDEPSGSCVTELVIIACNLEKRALFSFIIAI